MNIFILPTYLLIGINITSSWQLLDLKDSVQYNVDRDAEPRRGQPPDSLQAKTSLPFKIMQIPT